MTEVDPKLQKIIKIDSIFTPAAPIDKKDLFAGRKDKIDKVIESICEKGCHAIMYGDRGVGKTSLANIINEYLPESWVVKVGCDTSDDFTTIWHKIFKRMTLSHEQEKPRIGFKAEKEKKTFTLNGLLPKDRAITPDDICRIFASVDKITILIIDEFDRIIDVKTKTHFADIIKAMSDNLPRVTMLLVGVALDVNELIGKHQSIERSLRQIFLPRMSREELNEIIDKGFSRLNIKIDVKIRDRITQLSQGFPHYTHLLAKYCAKQTIEHNRDNVLLADLKMAMEQAIEDAQESIKEAYRKATIATRKGMFEEVLLACSLAKEDAYGTFRVMDIKEPLTRITGIEQKITSFIYHIGKLSSGERESILERHGSPKRFRYRFKNPLLKPFIILKGISKNLIREDLFKII